MATRRSLRLEDYHGLADLRYHVRNFLRVRELACRKIGIAPQHYQLLLQLKGLEGRAPATVSALAERLQLRHHSTVGLIDRLAARGFIQRRPDVRDRRQVIVELRPRGTAVLKRLALYSFLELRTEGPALVNTLGRLLRGPRRRKVRRARRARRRR